MGSTASRDDVDIVERLEWPRHKQTIKSIISNRAEEPDVFRLLKPELLEERKTGAGATQKNNQEPEPQKYAAPVPAPRR